MGKTTGLGAGFWLDGYDLSGDIGSLERMAQTQNLGEVTGIDKEAPERLAGLRDGGMTFNAWMNTSAGQSMPVLKTLPSTDRIATYVHRQSTIGTACFACVCKQANYAGNRATDGGLSWTVEVESNGYGLETGILVTAGKRTDTGATAGTAVDFAAATSFGLQAYLHVFAFTGTDATVKLQMDDNSGFTSATDVTGGGFTAITTAPVTQRIQTARNFATERYLRATTTTSAGFTSLTFAVIVVKNEVEINF
jgi:hypothetical protein